MIKRVVVVLLLVLVMAGSLATAMTANVSETPIYDEKEKQLVRKKYMRGEQKWQLQQVIKFRE